MLGSVNIINNVYILAIGFALKAFIFTKSFQYA